MNIDVSKLSIPVIFQKVGEELSGDDRFTKVKCWLMHTGKNLNNSFFTKEVINNAIPTLQYIPIVGFIENNKENEPDFSDHRYVIIRTKNGVEEKYYGSAYGVVLSNKDSDVHFETKICDDGIEREFIVANGIIWNMFEDSSDIINRDMIKDHSIELDKNSIDGYEDEDGVFHFTKFSFGAACILGNDVQPAMTGSTVEVTFSMRDFINILHEELNNKLTTFTKLVNEKTNQGGTEIMPNTDFSQTILEQFSDISAIVSQYETVTNRWGEDYPRFYLQDIQDNEVIVVDSKDNYHYYGFPFTVNGDKPEIDFACGKRKKVRYENYEDGAPVMEGAFDFGNYISAIEETAFSKITEANAKLEVAENDKINAETNYNQIKADYDDIKPKYDNYVKEEENRNIAALNAQKDEKIAEYENVLSDNVDFVALKEKKEEMSLDEIESKCAIIYAKATLPKSNFSKNTTNSITVGITNDSDNEDSDYIDTKYGRIRKSR